MLATGDSLNNSESLEFRFLGLCYNKHCVAVNEDGEQKVSETNNNKTLWSTTTTSTTTKNKMAGG